MTMKEKYIAEIENHVGHLNQLTDGLEFSKVASNLYWIVTESIKTVDERERNAAMQRRAELNG